MFLFSLPPDTRGHIHCFRGAKRPFGCPFSQRKPLGYSSLRRRPFGCNECVLRPSLDFTKLNSTYSLVQVDRVFAGDDVSDGAAGSLAGRLLAALCLVGHFYTVCR